MTPSGHSPASAATPSTEEEGEARQLRVDARANRRRLLEAAAEVFTAKGVSAPISEVAQRAGVGMGTVYRHFPTKEALFEAIVEEHVMKLLESAESLLDSSLPGAAFDEFLDVFSGAVSTKRCLVDALERIGVDVKARFGEVLSRLQGHVAVLLANTQAAGTVRPDVSVEDVFGLIFAACLVADNHGGDPATAERMLRLVRSGLRP
jgi:AcrR family transcriptional regulator